MWVQKKKNGKYQYFERYKDPRTGKLHTTSVTIDGNSKSDSKAAQKALTLRIQKLEKRPIELSSVTFGELCDEYTQYQADHFKEQTALSNKRKNNTLRRLLGDETLIRSLAAPIVRAAFESASPTTYNERIKRYKALMRWAYREELIEDISHLARLQVVKEPPARVKDRLKFMEKDEVKLLIDSMSQEDWKLLTKFMVLSGLRIGELISLEDEDVNFDTREIVIDKTYAMETKKVTSAKTECSAREVYMQNELLECCKEIAERKKRLREIVSCSSALFFPAVDGGFIQYDSYNKYLKENTARILGRVLTTHALRHTHVALMAENHVPLDVISRRLGHADSRVTKEIYFHVTKRLKNADNDLIKELKMI